MVSSEQMGKLLNLENIDVREVDDDKMVTTIVMQVYKEDFDRFFDLMVLIDSKIELEKQYEKFQRQLKKTLEYEIP